MKLVWTAAARADLADLIKRAPSQGRSVVDAAEWLARQRFRCIGRYVPETVAWYWPVPPQGIFYRTDPGRLLILRVRDARRRQAPW